MKLCLILVAFALMSLGANLGAEAGPVAAARPSVVDYFYEIARNARGFDYLDKKDAPAQFAVKDTAHGYLEADPASGDGRVTLALFRGKGRDLGVLETKECGPGCRYGYAGVVFTGGKYEKHAPLTKFYPLAEMAKKARGLVGKVKGRASVPDEWPAEESFRFSLPRRGKATKVWVLAPANALMANDETYFEVGTLSWSPVAFRFSFKAAKVARDLGQLDLY